MTQMLQQTPLLSPESLEHLARETLSPSGSSILKNTYFFHWDAYYSKARPDGSMSGVGDARVLRDSAGNQFVYDPVYGYACLKGSPVTSLSDHQELELTLDRLCQEEQGRRS